MNAEYIYGIAHTHSIECTASNGSAGRITTCLVTLRNYPTFYMWPMFENAPSIDLGQRKPLAFTELVARMGDFSDLELNDVALKFWLPQAAFEALGEMAERSSLTMTEFLRQFFVVHCYGLYAFIAMKEAKPSLFKDSLPGTNVFYQSVGQEQLPSGKIRVETYWVPELGKNISPVKVWMPKRMRCDLEALAKHSALTLSNYVREIVISRLLGHGMLPTRSILFQVFATPEANAWCEGQEIPWREVSRDEINRFIVRRQGTRTVDAE